MADATGNPSTRDYRWQRIVDNVPSDFLLKLAKTRKGYKLENLTKGQESLVDEVFRICDTKTVNLLYEQFIDLNGPIWYYAPQSAITRKSVSDAMRQNIDPILVDGNKTTIGRKPELYRVDHQTDAVLFRFAAMDGVQNIRTGISERTKVEVLNEYTSILHFSDPRLVVVGPYTSEKANSVAAELKDSLKSDVDWRCLKAKRGERRSFYDAAKKALTANLIDTKRHDPVGDYETIAFEARPKHPDLEKVPNFKSGYLHANSIYDVLQFTFLNPVGIEETTNVKFGTPFGKFTFRARTSLAAVYHFEGIIYALLS